METGQKKYKIIKSRLLKNKYKNENLFQTTQEQVNLKLQGKHYTTVPTNNCAAHLKRSVSDIFYRVVISCWEVSKSICQRYL